MHLSKTGILFARLAYTIAIPKSVISQVRDIYVVSLITTSEVDPYHEVMMEEEEKRREEDDNGELDI